MDLSSFPGPYARPAPLAATGATVDPAVLQAQQMLYVLVGPLSLDGIMGPETREAISQFQNAHRLPVTGELNGQTVAALQSAFAASGASLPAPAGGAATSTSPSGTAPAALARPAVDWRSIALWTGGIILVGGAIFLLARESGALSAPKRRRHLADAPRCQRTPNLDAFEEAEPLALEAA